MENVTDSSRLYENFGHFETIVGPPRSLTISAMYNYVFAKSWWCHQIEFFSSLLALFEGSQVNFAKKITRWWSNNTNKNNSSSHSLLFIVQAASTFLIINLIECLFSADILGHRWQRYNVQQDVEPRWPDCEVPLLWLLWRLSWWSVFKTTIRSLIKIALIPIFLGCMCANLAGRIKETCRRTFWWREILHSLITLQSAYKRWG